jgi:hypothetical protein
MIVDWPILAVTLQEISPELHSPAVILLLAGDEAPRADLDSTLEFLCGQTRFHAPEILDDFGPVKAQLHGGSFCYRDQDE